MSKGFHRLPVEEPWSNRARSGQQPHPQAHTPEDIGGLAAAVGDRPTRIPMEAPVPAADFEPGLPKMTREQATSAGFTGNQCAECGSLQMVRNGTCEKCSACGSTTGCS